MNIYFKLALVFMKIGLFSYGGGNAILPLINQEVVISNSWLTNNEFTDLIAISQVTPGPIAVNASTYIGYKVAGFWGSVLATVALVLPTFIIMYIVTRMFLKFKNSKHVQNALSGIIPVTVGLISSAALLIAPSSFIDYKSIIICLGVFIAFYKYKVDPILLTIISGVIGFILYS
ncbi:chromate transporter [Clostridium cellulovorans]|uniref:Chromate transporter n=1 Tax=Clostridium cellulovorans (strain ATCC 35296 / DSM 3052 / OCM 3 / 743B) TaxID=573061 RepID=D9SW91_CLOC7|nr:chromate transporter [Clostridium cellulovorans]ADL51235.1 Chromate transporter [Clostridium cellulovorans 743B]